MPKCAVCGRTGKPGQFMLHSKKFDLYLCDFNSRGGNNCYGKWASKISDPKLNDVDWVYVTGHPILDSAANPNICRVSSGVEMIQNTLF